AGGARCGGGAGGGAARRSAARGPARTAAGGGEGRGDARVRRWLAGRAGGHHGDRGGGGRTQRQHDGGAGRRPVRCVPVAPVAGPGGQGYGQGPVPAGDRGGGGV